MIKDTKMAEVFQIPPRMLQKWKKSSDYRYLIYTFLQHNEIDELEAFFKYFLSKNISTKNNNVAEESYRSNLINKKAVGFMYKKDFMSKLKENMSLLLNNDEFTVLTSEDMVLLCKDSKTIELISSTFLVKDNDSNLIYVELSNRIVEKGPLIKKTTQIIKSIKDNYVLEKMIFLTNEKVLPKFIREDNKINTVKIENVNVDEFANNVLNMRKIIFVPPELKLPQ